MVDFKKMLEESRDPAYQAKRQAERDAEQARIEAKDKAISDAITLLTNHDVFETLPEKEQGLVRNCRSLVGRYFPLTEPQEKWLFDIAKRNGYQPATAADDTIAPAQEDDPENTDRP